jgi:hypothetical protein
MDERDLAVLTKLLDNDVELGEVVNLIDSIFRTQACAVMTETT